MNKYQAILFGLMLAMYSCGPSAEELAHRKEVIKDSTDLYTFTLAAKQKQALDSI